MIIFSNLLAVLLLFFLYIVHILKVRKLKKESEEFWQNNKKIYSKLNIDQTILSQKYVKGYYNRASSYFLAACSALLFFLPILFFISASFLYSFLENYETLTQLNISRYFFETGTTTIKLFKNDPNSNILLAQSLVKGGNLFIALMLMMASGLTVILPFIFFYYKYKPQSFEVWEREVLAKKK